MKTIGTTRHPTLPRSTARRAASPGRGPAGTSDPLGRVDTVDAARGFAITMMIAYHFCFDLTWYGWAGWAMLADGRWIAWRSAIVTSFLFVVGVSLALRDRRERREAERRGGAADAGAGVDPRRPDRAFARRWLQVACAAALVTAGSAVLFPRSFIYFGVLHFVAAAIVLCRRGPRLGGWAFVLGCAVIAVGLGWSNEAFNPRIVDWIGFATEKPLTEDYVPLFPWLGVVLIGCAAGARWARSGFRLSSAAEAAWQAVPHALRRLLATMGRWSLTIYLLHQPVMLGAMALIAQAR